MIRRRWMAAAAAATTAALLLAACGGGTDRTKAQVRLVNASSGYTSLELRVDGEVLQAGVSYGNSASYVEAKPGKSSEILATGGASALLTFTPSTEERKYYTVLAYGPAGTLKQVVLDENRAEPDTNRSLLRVVNAAPDVGPVDVYVTGVNEPLATAVALRAGIAVDSVGDFDVVNSGTWKLRVTAAGSKDDLLVEIPSVTMASKQVFTLVVTPAPGGILGRALLLTQQGGIANHAATLARVRVASGLPTAGVRLGDTELLPAGGNLPSVSKYSVLSAGNQTLVATINGVAQPSSVMALTAGLDYTLLVHGTSAAPLYSWIEDDNTKPADLAKAKVRLVNGVSGASGSLSMTVDGQQIAASVAAGGNSVYQPQPASTTADIVVASPDSTVFTVLDQTFLAASNYTVFVLGPSSAATGVLRKDR